jgi:uncharacterized membrane protein YeaQ/YmgE (transglycosylase-associated protein family)
VAPLWRDIRKSLMSIIVFILLGLAVCGFTHGLFNGTRIAVMVDLCTGVIGAVIAGSLFNHIAVTGAARLNITSALVAALTGAVVLLAACHAMFRETRSTRIPASIPRTKRRWLF